MQFIGAPPFDGAMTPRLWAPRSKLVALPQNFDGLDAAMLEPLEALVENAPGYVKALVDLKGP